MHANVNAIAKSSGWTEHNCLLQTKFGGKVMFLLVPVILFTVGGRPS